MGTHIMERSLLLCCLVALVIPANSLKCLTCAGDDCSSTEVTCPGESDKCATTALYIDSFPCQVRKVFKGCINSNTTSKKLSISPNELTTLSLQQEICDSDLCNTQHVPEPNTKLNDLHCYSCISPGASCNSDKMKDLQCMGEQKMCVDVKIIGRFGDTGDVNVKGCAQISSSSKNLVFSSQTSSVFVQSCNGNYCNSATDSGAEDKTPNGIQCYSCNTLDGASCSPEEVVKAQCYGELTSCLEVAGTNMKDGRSIPSVIKGCATPSMCDSSVLPMLQKLGTAIVKCCNGSLCNNQFSESELKASGYLPIGNGSPGTGNNTAGGGNNSSAGTSGSSSFGGYSNIPGNNESSTTYTSSGNGTGMTNEWNNSNNSSNHNMVVPVGYVNIPGNNDSTTYYTTSSSGTGMTSNWSNSSYPNVSATGGHANMPGSNNYSTSYASSDNGTGITNEWINNNNSYHNMASPGGNYESFNSNGSNSFSNSNYSSNSMMHNNGSNYGNGSNFGNSWGSIGSYLNHISSGANDNGSYTNSSSLQNELIPGGSSYSNETAWIYGSNYDPNLMANNNNNGSFSNYNNIQNFISKVNGYIHGNDSTNINEWIQNNSFFSNLMPPGMNHNGSGPTGYNTNFIYNGSLIDYFNSYIHNITSNFSGSHNGSFNISDFISGWRNIIKNPNLMNPHPHHNGSTYSSELITSNNGSSYSNIQNPNVISSSSPNSNGSNNTNGYFGEAGFNGQPNNTYGMSSGGHNQLSPGGNNTASFFNNGSNAGHETLNSSSYNTNMMIPGLGSGGSSYGGASTDGNSNGYNTNLMGHGLNGSMFGNGSNTNGTWSNSYNPDLLVPGRSTNDSTSGGAGNSTGGGNGTMFNSASSLWTKSGSLLIFSAIALLVLN